MNIAEEIRATPIQKLHHDVYKSRNLEVFVKREDLSHPIISGNKWHKLKFNLSEAKTCSHIVSFGGAWSNHLHSLAYASMKEGIKLSALIRGEELANKPLNAMLADMQDWAADLYFISREQYRLKEQSKSFLALFSQEAVFVIPEGANNESGIAGCEDFATHTLKQFQQEQGALPTHVLLASGTGAMTAGFIKAMQNKTFSMEILKSNLFLKSYLAVKDKNRVRENIVANTQNLNQALSWMLDDSYAGKGFAQVDNKLSEFMKLFYEQQGFELDPVYNAKLFYGFHEDVLKNLFPANSRILLIHSGGLQGLRGFTNENL